MIVRCMPFIQVFCRKKDTVSNYLIESNNEFIQTWRQRLQLLLSKSDDKDSNRERIYNQTVDDLRHRKNLIRNAHNDIISLLHSFEEGVISHNTFFADLNQSYLNHFVPKPEMKRAYDIYSYGRPLSDTIKFCKTELSNLYLNAYAAADQFIELTETVFSNSHNDSVNQLCTNIINTYVNAILKSNSCRDILDRLIFRIPIFWLENNYELSNKKFGEFTSVFINAHEVVSHVDEVVHHSILAMNSAIKFFIGVTNEYVESKQHSLTDVHSVLLSEKVQLAITQLKDFSFEVDTREQALYEHITNLIIIPDHLWFEVSKIADEVFDTYKNLFDYDLSLRNHSEARLVFDDRLRHARDNFNIRKLLGNIDHDFIKAIGDIAQ